MVDGIAKLFELGLDKSFRWVCGSPLPDLSLSTSTSTSFNFNLNFILSKHLYTEIVSIVPIHIHNAILSSF